MIEYTGIFLELSGVKDKASVLRQTGLYEGPAGLTSVSCMDQERAIVKIYERKKRVPSVKKQLYEKIAKPYPIDEKIGLNLVGLDLC